MLNHQVLTAFASCKQDKREDISQCSREMFFEIFGALKKSLFMAVKITCDSSRDHCPEWNLRAFSYATDFLIHRTSGRLASMQALEANFRHNTNSFTLTTVN
jgi:hypothetical protein